MTKLKCENYSDLRQVKTKPDVQVFMIDRHIQILSDMTEVEMEP